MCYFVFILNLDIEVKCQVIIAKLGFFLNEIDKYGKTDLNFVSLLVINKMSH